MTTNRCCVPYIQMYGISVVFSLVFRVPKGGKKGFHILRQGRTKVHPFTRVGVSNGKFRGVKHLAVGLDSVRVRPTVKFVADHWMFDVRHVYADLMGSSRFNSYAKECRAIKGFDNFIR